jgi:DNA mismatch endonuclease (patch repair protein)
MGYRYGLHAKNLPGKPDLVFRTRKKIIFVHGCFWHGHQDPKCRRSRLPKTRRDFWSAKIKRNAERDVAKERALQDAGWEVLTVWECETPPFQREALAKKLASFLRRERLAR